MFSFRILRKNLNPPQSSHFVASQIGISPSTLWRLENAKFPIAERTIILASRYYKVPCGRLLSVLDQLSLLEIKLYPRNIVLQLNEELQEEFYQKHPLFV